MLGSGAVDRLLILSLMLLSLSCAPDGPSELVLTAQVPLHLEMHLDDAHLDGSAIPTGGRLKREVIRGESRLVSVGGRLAIALAGGLIMGIAARFARAMPRIASSNCFSDLSEFISASPPVTRMSRNCASSSKYAIRRASLSGQVSRGRS